MIGLLFLPLGLVALVTQFNRTPGTPAGPVQPPPPPVAVAGLLPSGLVRIVSRVSMGYVSQLRAAHGRDGQKIFLDDVKRRLESFGVKGVRAVVQDPTDNTLVSAIGEASALVSHGDGTVQIERIDPVEAPPNYIVSEAGLDPGLLPDELGAIRYALVAETNPRHLCGLALTCEPYHPIAASLLRARAMLLECRAIRNRIKLVEANDAAGKQIQELVGADKKIDLVGQVGPTPGASLAQIVKDTAPSWTDVQKAFASLPNPAPKGWNRWEQMRAALAEHRNEPNKIITPSDVAKMRVDVEALAKKVNYPLEVMGDEVRRVACDIIEQPKNLTDPTAFKEFPPEVVVLGRSLIREVGPGIWIVDPDRLRAACPWNHDPAFVSPQALKLSNASGKPMMSGVGNAGRVKKIYQAIQAPRSGHDVDQLLARAQLERANRAIERRRWVNWYHNLRMLES